MAFIHSQGIAMERRYGDNKDIEMHRRHYDLAKRWQMKEVLPDSVESFGDFLTDIMGGGDADDDKKQSDVAPATADQSFGAMTSDGISGQASNKAASSDTSSANNAAQLGSVTIPLKVWQDENGNEREVQAQMNIGGKPFSLTQDTGSVTPWIKKSALDKAGAKSKSVGQHFSIQYGIGEVSGDLHSGTISADKLSVKHVRIGAATKLSSDLSGDPSDGLMGYAFKDLSQSKTDTFLDRTFAQNNFDQKHLCFAIGRSNDGTLGKSQMRFGGADPSTVKGEMSWYPISKLGYWQIAIDTFAPNGGKGAGVTQDAVVDTGTSIIPVGRDGAKSFFQDVKGAKYDSKNQVYTFPCDTKINAALKMKDGKTITLRENDVNLGKVDTGSSQCVASIVPLDTNGVTVLGLPFLRSSIACLDHGAQKVGLADPAF